MWDEDPKSLYTLKFFSTSYLEESLLKWVTRILESKDHGQDKIGYCIRGRLLDFLLLFPFPLFILLHFYFRIFVAGTE